MLIAALVREGVLDSMDLDGDGVASTQETAALLSNFVISVEMLIMAGGKSLGPLGRAQPKGNLTPSPHNSVDHKVWRAPCAAVFLAAFPPSDYTEATASRPGGARYKIRRSSLDSNLLNPVGLDPEVSCTPMACSGVLLLHTAS